MVFVCGGTLPAGVASQGHEELARIVRRHTFVGVVNDTLSLLQHTTKLYLVNHVALGREMFYQQALRLFANMFPFDLEPAPAVRDLALLALDDWPGKQSLTPTQKAAEAEVRPRAVPLVRPSSPECSRAACVGCRVSRACCWRKVQC